MSRAQALIFPSVETGFKKKEKRNQPRKDLSDFTFLDIYLLLIKKNVVCYVFIFFSGSGGTLGGPFQASNAAAVNPHGPGLENGLHNKTSAVGAAPKKPFAWAGASEGRRRRTCTCTRGERKRGGVAASVQANVKRRGKAQTRRGRWWDMLESGFRD